jgi:hypothetical protein
VFGGTCDEATLDEELCGLVFGKFGGLDLVSDGREAELEGVPEGIDALVVGARQFTNRRFKGLFEFSRELTQGKPEFERLSATIAFQDRFHGITETMGEHRREEAIPIGEGQGLKLRGRHRHDEARKGLGEDLRVSLGQGELLSTCGLLEPQVTRTCSGT